jgi:translation initiation factor 1 (eIF-1/SUI1)
MGKKDKRANPVEIAETPQLTHSPFASLSAKLPSAPVTDNQPAADSGSARDEPTAKRKTLGRLVLRRETKHRAGKAVIVISGFGALANFDAAAIESLAKQCRQKLGCGGSVHADEILLQGDRAADVAAMLRALGFRVEGVTT